MEGNLAERNRRPHKWTGIRPDYISNAEYDLLLAPLLETFRPEQVMLVFTELLRDQAAAILADTLRFLGLDPSKLDGTRGTQSMTGLHFNSRDAHVVLKPEHRISAAVQKRMCDHFYTHNWRLAVHLNVTRLPWKTCGLGPHVTYTANGYGDVAVGGPLPAPETTEADLDALLTAALAKGSVRDAAAEVASVTGLPRKTVYARALELKDGR